MFLWCASLLRDFYLTEEVVVGAALPRPWTMVRRAGDGVWRAPVSRNELVVVVVPGAPARHVGCAFLAAAPGDLRTKLVCTAILPAATGTLEIVKGPW
jgi:hypothetical protein